MQQPWRKELRRPACRAPATTSLGGFLNLQGGEGDMLPQHSSHPSSKVAPRVAPHSSLLPLQLPISEGDALLQLCGTLAAVPQGYNTVGQQQHAPYIEWHTCGTQCGLRLWPRQRFSCVMIQIRPLQKKEASSCITHGPSNMWFDLFCKCSLSCNLRLSIPTKIPFSFNTAGPHPTSLHPDYLTKVVPWVNGENVTWTHFTTEFFFMT